MQLVVIQMHWNSRSGDVQSANYAMRGACCAFLMNHDKVFVQILWRWGLNRTGGSVVSSVCLTLMHTQNVVILRGLVAALCPVFAWHWCQLIFWKLCYHLCYFILSQQQICLLGCEGTTDSFSSGLDWMSWPFGGDSAWFWCKKSLEMSSCVVSAQKMTGQTFYDMSVTCQ